MKSLAAKKAAKGTKGMRETAQALQNLVEVNVRQSIIQELPPAGTWTSYHEGYISNLSDKVLAMDRKALPDHIDEYLARDIHYARQRAYKESKRMTPRQVMSEARKISGRNYAIPEWAIARDVIPHDTAARHSDREISFYKNIFSMRATSLRALADDVGTSTSPADRIFGEMFSLGFENPISVSTIAPMGTLDPTILRNGPKNYLEICRLNVNWWYAYLEATFRHDCPIYTLTNRAKRLSPLYSKGASARPFPIELGGVVYFIDGVDAGEILYRCKQRPELFLLGCVGTLIWKTQEYDRVIVQVEQVIADQKMNSSDKKAPHSKSEWSQKWMNHLIKEVPLCISRSLLEAGKISQSEFELITELKNFSLPTDRSFIMLCFDYEERQERLAEYDRLQAEVTEEFNATLQSWGISSVPTDDTFLAWGNSALDDISGSDEEGGFWGNAFDEDAPSVHESSSEDEPEPDKTFDLDPSQDRGSSLTSTLVDVRFISAVRMWPHQWKSGDPG